MGQRKYTVGMGWQPLIEEAAARLEPMGIHILMAYEKYGTLRLSLDTEPEAATDILLEIEERSGHICERCGRHGDQVETPRGWVKTLCPECAAAWDGNSRSLS